MSRKDRSGQRKKRGGYQRIPELGYYLIYTDTKETEKNYFEGLRGSLPSSIRNKLTIKVKETETKSLVDDCLDDASYRTQFMMPWIVFDRDQVKNYDDIIKAAEDAGIGVAWSNPCFEMWMFAYFGKMPAIFKSTNCCADFRTEYKRRTGKEYLKSEKRLYSILCEYGDEKKAIEIARQKIDQCVRDGKEKPSEMCPCTTVHLLVQEIRSKVESDES